jgi:type IV secretory pathway VirB4 component
MKINSKIKQSLSKVSSKNILGSGQRNITVADVIAPSAIKVFSGSLYIGERISRTFFVFSFSRYLTTAWFSPVVDMNFPMNIAIYIFPADNFIILKQLRKKITEVQAELIEREEKGLISDPALETSFTDLENLRKNLITAQERMFDVGLYITICGDSKKEIEEAEVQLRQILESRLIYIKPTTFQQKKGATTVFPYLLDKLAITSMMNTAPLSTIFPFVSSDLTSDQGVLYGINKYNNSLVLFDRFSLENANMVIFSVSGGGKSYFQKLEILRSLIFGVVDVIVIDPENEYEHLCEAVGGSFLKISLGSKYRLNPFDLPLRREGDDQTNEDILRSSIIDLVGLIGVMFKGLTPIEEAIINKALYETYAARDITAESDFSRIEDIPKMIDLQDVLETMEGAEELVIKLRKFTEGTYANFFNQETNINMDSNMIVFALRDMEEDLQPIAMYMILKYIWTSIRASFKKRILLIDEAWWMMQTEEGARFLFSLVKRARKYWLGVSTITHDVSDFMRSTYGQPIITNSALRFLLKQSSATINLIVETFALTDQEKFILLESPIGEGIFFAGTKRVVLQVVPSYSEDQIITTSPEQVAAIKKAREKQKAQR